MKLNSISLRHAHHFSDLNIEFKYSDKPITLILGDQSSGKTAILKNIYQSLTWFSARFKDARTAGVVMPDSDITFNRVQSRIDIQIQIPDEIGTLPESTTSEEKDVKQCAWRLYKTIQANGVGFSKVDTLQLEQTIQLYHKALAQDPLLGLPMIAYYPSDRFVNDINLISKNNPAVFQNHSAYELVVLPYTTFARFFEWFREICDIENAQAANLFQQILIDAKEIKSTDQITVDHDEKNVEFAKSLFQAHAQLHAGRLRIQAGPRHMGRRLRRLRARPARQLHQARQEPEGQGRLAEGREGSARRGLGTPGRRPPDRGGVTWPRT